MYKQNDIRKVNQKKAHSEPDYLHTYTGHSSIATIVIIGIYANIINIYHEYPNKIFIMSPIITISILGSVMAKCPILK